MTAGTPTPTREATILLSDPLRSNTNGWLEDNTHCQFQPDGYHVFNGYFCNAPNLSLNDGSVRVDVKQVSGTTRYGYGIVFREQNTGRYYIFLVFGNGYWRVSKEDRGSSTDIVSVTPTQGFNTALGSTNRLEVRMDGPHLHFLINENEVGQVDDDAIITGFVGLPGDLGSRTGEEVFTNFVAASY